MENDFAFVLGNALRFGMLLIAETCGWMEKIPLTKL
jgi:hypothetical protein